MGFGLGATGCPCAELLPSAQASRRQARSQGTSVDTILQCQNLPPPSSVLPICRIPAQAEPPASTEEMSPSAPSMLMHPHLQCATETGVVRGGLVPLRGDFRKGNSPVASLSPAPMAG